MCVRIAPLLLSFETHLMKERLTHVTSFNVLWFFPLNSKLPFEMLQSAF